jgi:hypothetical protein
MFLKRLLRWGGALLILAGLIMLAYAGYTYAQVSLAEREAEAHIPGQVAVIAGASPTAQPSPPAGTASATLVPTATSLPPPTEISATIIPTVISQPRPSEISATALPALQTVVGPQGLPRGQGADPERLIIPRLKLDTGVKEATWAVVDENGMATSEWQIPFDKVAHLSTTPKPGEAGNAVISGHHNLIGPNKFGLGKFAGLWNLDTGDPVYIYDSLGRVFLYRVSSHYFVKELGEPLSVREEHASNILKDSRDPIVTFETCWNGAQAPLSGNTYRWIVIAALVGTIDPIQDTMAVNQPPPSQGTSAATSLPLPQPSITANLQSGIPDP